MRYVTEGEMRDAYAKAPFSTYHLSHNIRLTPGARTFLIDQRVDIIDPTAPKRVKNVGHDAEKNGDLALVIAELWQAALDIPADAALFADLAESLTSGKPVACGCTVSEKMPDFERKLLTHPGATRLLRYRKLTSLLAQTSGDETVLCAAQSALVQAYLNLLGGVADEASL